MQHRCHWCWPPFPEWWDNLPPTVQKTARQQHHICSWGYSHQSGTELLPTHGPSPSWCGSLLWLNVLFAGNWGWRHRKPFFCHIMILLWSLSDKSTRVRFCWVPSQCGIDGNERVDQLAKETLDQDIDPLASVHFTDMKPLVNYYIQKLVQTKWDVAVHGRDLLSCETSTGAPNQRWRVCNHPTSNWPYQGHQIPFLVPRTANWVSPL